MKILPPTETQTTTRRSLLGSGAILAGSLVMGRIPHVARASETGTTGLAPLNRFPRMMQEFMVREVRTIHRQRLERFAQLANRQDAEAWVRSARERIAASFGPYPEKTPLNARVTGIVERYAYKIEKVVFESRPDFPVTANLYVPKGARLPAPGVVGTCGHSSDGKAYVSYQSFAQGLARLGYVVLIFDPIGQGERSQYVDRATWEPRIKGTTAEHNHIGGQQLLVGEHFCSWRAWDGIRALDYLMTREEVDHNHLGITGNSGGGTATTWLCGVEDRWTMAAPGCFVTEFRRNLENELPADIEQCPPRVLALGLDHEDFLAALAPKPVIILSKERDYFDVRGNESAYQRLKSLYRLLGAEENIGYYAGPTQHGFSQENREAMYRWFNSITGVSDQKTEPEIVLEEPGTLQCTPHGQVAEWNPRTVFSFTREKSRSLATKRLDLDGGALVQTVAEVLRIPKRRSAPEYRILRRRANRRYPKPHSTTYVVETEPGVQAVVYRLSGEPVDSRPPKAGRPAVLYVPHLSADAELRTEPLVRQLLAEEPEAVLFTCDPRCCGESQPDTCNEKSFLDNYGSDYFYAAHSNMLDRPLVGQKSFDLLRVLDWLDSVGHSEIHLAAVGRGAVPAAFAALLAERVNAVTLKHAPASYSDIADTELYRWPLSALVPDVLRYFDLPDCYRELEKRQLRLIEPWGATPSRDEA